MLWKPRVRSRRGSLHRWCSLPVQSNSLSQDIEGKMLKTSAFIFCDVEQITTNLVAQNNIHLLSHSVQRSLAGSPAIKVFVGRGVSSETHGLIPSSLRLWAEFRSLQLDDRGSQLLESIPFHSCSQYGCLLLQGWEESIAPASSLLFQARSAPSFIGLSWLDQDHPRFSPFD